MKFNATQILKYFAHTHNYASDYHSLLWDYKLGNIQA